MNIGSVTTAPIQPATVNHRQGESVPPVQPVEMRRRPAAAKPEANNIADIGIQKEMELMDKPIAQANEALKPLNRSIERAVHEVTRTIMYTITDTRTKEVIAEFPQKKIQDMIAKMWELAGLFVDENA